MTDHPRVTLGDIEANIAGENFINAGNAAELCGQPASARMFLMTICFLTLKNGFVVTGESSCVSPENYNEDLGRQFARKAAIEKIWPLMGYDLRQRLMHEKQS